MVEIRSGMNTGGQNPSTPDGRDPNIPENIEFTGQGDQTANQGAQMQDPSQQQGQSPAAAQGVLNHYKVSNIILSYALMLMKHMTLIKNTSVTHCPSIQSASPLPLHIMVNFPPWLLHVASVCP